MAFPYDRAAISAPQYSYYTNFDTGAQLRLGAGVNMEYPDQPRIAYDTPFRTAAALPGTPIPDTLGSVTSQFFEAKTVEEESQIFRVHFKGRLGSLDASAAFNYISEQRKTSVSRYAIHQSLSSGFRIDPSGVNWTAQPDEETISSLEDRAWAFVQRYGTHYVAEVQLAFVVAVRGTVDSHEASRIQELTAAMSYFSASGELSAQQRNFFSSSQTRIEADISGAIESAGIQIPAIGPDAVGKLLEILGKSSAKVSLAPYRVTVRSYYSTLREYPKCQEIFAPALGTAADSPFGVPRGTVIAWMPTINDFILVGPEKYRLRPPDGWEVVGRGDGDIHWRQRFIRVSDTPDDPEARDGLTGGSDTHVHDISITGSSGNEAAGSRSYRHAAHIDHTHKTTTAPVDNIPAFVSLVHIRKT